MKYKEEIEKIQKYPLHFCYGEVGEKIGYYEIPQGIFFLCKVGSEIELWWGTNSLDDLLEGVKQVSQKHNTSFILRYPGKTKEVQEASQTIAMRGYRLEHIHLAYKMELLDLPAPIENKKIRPFQAEDMEDLINLDRQVFPSMNIEPRELSFWLEEEKAIIFVTQNESGLNGFVIIEVYGDNNEYCFVRSLAVSPESRGKGLGKKLFLKGLNEAKEKGIKKCMLWVELSNKPARAMYETVGFKIDENEVEAVFRV